MLKNSSTEPHSFLPSLQGKRLLLYRRSAAVQNSCLLHVISENVFSKPEQQAFVCLEFIFGNLTVMKLRMRILLVYVDYRCL